LLQERAHFCARLYSGKEGIEHRPIGIRLIIDRCKLGDEIGRIMRLERDIVAVILPAQRPAIASKS
jgi:hypothetical protein